MTELRNRMDEAMVLQIEEIGVQGVKSRSPLVCAAKQGVCAKCYGMDLSRSAVAEPGLAVGIISAAFAVLIGVVVGAIAGYFGGWADALLMRVAEFFQTLPRFVVALIVIALFDAIREINEAIQRSSNKRR